MDQVIEDLLMERNRLQARLNRANGLLKEAKEVLDDTYRTEQIDVSVDIEAFFKEINYHE